MNTAAIENIEREIDHTRRALDRTIRELQVELSPRHRIQVAWRSAKSRAARKVRYGADWAMANPVPVRIGAVVLAAAAIAMAIQRTRR